MKNHKKVLGKKRLWGDNSMGAVRNSIQKPTDVNWETIQKKRKV